MRPINLKIAAAMSAIVSLATVPLCLADADADARALFDQTYGVAVRGVKTTRSSEDDGKLGAILLGAAQAKNAGTEAYRILLLEQAYEHGKLHTTGMRAAADALQELARLVPRRQLESQEKLLVLYETVFRNAAGKPNKDNHKKAGAATTDLIVEIAQVKARRAEYAAALAQLTKATGIARSVGYTDRAGDIKKMMDEMSPLAPIDTRVQAAKRALAKDPADKAAAKTITDLYLKDLDRPLTAKTYAEIVMDAKAVALFTLAGQPVDDLNADEARSLAKWYETLATEGASTTIAKTNTLVRAKVYYQRLLEAKAGDADAKAGLTKVDATLAGLNVEEEKVAALVKSRRERLAIVAVAKPKPVAPVNPPNPPKPVPPPKPVVDPPKVNPKPVDPVNPPAPAVVEPDPEKVEPEFREEELDDAYWKKRKSIFDFGM